MHYLNVLFMGMTLGCKEHAYFRGCVSIHIFTRCIGELLSVAGALAIATRALEDVGTERCFLLFVFWDLRDIGS